MCTLALAIHLACVSPSAAAWAHAGAVAFDGVTTRQAITRGWVEADPLTRPLIGTQPSYQRMAPWGAAEVGVGYLVAKRWPRAKWLQLGLSAIHIGAGVHNLTLGRRR